MANPNHDQRGKFTSGGSGGGSSRAADDAAARIRARDAAAAIVRSSDARGKDQPTSHHVPIGARVTSMRTHSHESKQRPPSGGRSFYG